MEIIEVCYLLTVTRNESVDIYSVRAPGDPPTVFLFEERADAERYVIMLEQDEDYVVGETLDMDITEVPLTDAIDALDDKGHSYILIRSDELFVPPDGKLS